MADPKPTARAHGRSLADFPKLSAAEQKLIACARNGEWCELDPKRPEKPTEANTIRAGLIRFLALGGDDDNPVHERGVQLRGAWVPDGLNLDAVIATRRLAIVQSHFKTAIRVQDAQLSALSLDGSRIPGLNADRCHISGSTRLCSDFKSIGAVRLLGAQIGGTLVCSGGSFENAGDVALAADGIMVGGRVFLDQGFNASGTVRLHSAQIGGALICSGGRFAGANGIALNAEGARVEGSVFLSNSFYASGEVSLTGAKIGGTLECGGGRFENVEGYALHAESAVVKGTLYFRGVNPIKGLVNFASAHFASIADDITSWPVNALMLDGFRYDHIGSGPTDASTRIAWLKKQHPRFLNEDFAPQPWEQLIKVLREMGHGRDADEVAIAKQHALRAAGKIGTRKPKTDFPDRWWMPIKVRRWIDARWNDLSNFVARCFHDLYGKLAGYGYRPTRIILWVIGLLAISAFAFSTAAENGLMAPTNPVLHAHEAGANVNVTACGANGDVQPPQYWVRCAGMPAEYTTFSPLGYAADMILPLVNLQQDSEWGPVVSNAKGPLYWGVVTRLLGWFDILSGWIVSLMFVAIVSRLVEKD